MDKFAVIGESHSGFFSGEDFTQIMLLFDQNRVPLGMNVTSQVIENFRVIQLGPALAYNLNKYSTTNRTREKIELLLKTEFIKKGQPILCCFGEIDCRVHVIRQAAKQNVGFESVVDDVLDNYLEFLFWLRREHPVYVWGPVPSQKDGSPINPEFPYYGSEVERNRATKYFNEQLEARCGKCDVKFLSIFKHLIDENYKTREEFIVDGCHLSQKAWAFALDEFRAAGIEIKFTPTWKAHSVNAAILFDNHSTLLARNVSDEILFVERLTNKLRVADVKSEKFIRVGASNAGGFVMADDFQSNNIVYDFTVRENFSWDEALSERAMKVFVYNPYVQEPHFNTPNIVFTKALSIGNETPAQPHYKTLSNFLTQNGHEHEKNMLLKLDITGHEYNVLHTIRAETLRQFSQIIVIFYGLTQPRFENLISFALDKLNLTHQLVHVHGDNRSNFVMKGGKVLPNILECTFMRRGLDEFVPSTRFFPTELDAPNDPNRPEIQLGCWSSID